MNERAAANGLVNKYLETGSIHALIGFLASKDAQHALDLLDWMDIFDVHVFKPSNSPTPLNSPSVTTKRKCIPEYNDSLNDNDQLACKYMKRLRPHFTKLLDVSNQPSNPPPIERPIKDYKPKSCQSNRDRTMDLKNLEHQIGYTFINPQLLDQALTHKSCTKGPSNQRLEIMGDAILEFLMTLYFFKMYPGISSTLLQELKVKAVRNSTLSKLAILLNLNEYLDRDNANLDRMIDQYVQDFCPSLHDDEGKLDQLMM